MMHLVRTLRIRKSEPCVVCNVIGLDPNSARLSGRAWSMSLKEVETGANLQMVSESRGRLFIYLFITTECEWI